MGSAHLFQPDSVDVDSVHSTHAVFVIEAVYLFYCPNCPSCQAICTALAGQLLQSGQH